MFDFSKFAEVERAEKRKRYIELTKRIEDHIVRKAGLATKGKAVDIYMNVTKDIRTKLAKQHKKSELRLPPLTL